MLYPEAVDFLTSPGEPYERLELVADAELDRYGAVYRGTLRCGAHGPLFAVEQGIANLIAPDREADSVARVTNYLPLTAWAYERTWRPHALSLLTGQPFGYDRELPLIASLMQPEREGLYLDVGCSTGLYARALTRQRREQHGHVIGIDLSRPMLQQAHTFATEQGLRVSFVQASAQHLPFAQGSAAGVAMGGSLNEIGDVDACLREIRRVLAPTGRCVMMNLLQSQVLPGQVLQQTLQWSGIDFWTRDELNQRFAASGLRLIDQWCYGIVVFSLLLV
ncbi:MAG: class I SAM-dependent methyltransferase [Chloroflexaceae bacterium]|nr:class I SAM-dependent methyltransferase [Chloroflexaceae bacterium]